MAKVVAKAQADAYSKAQQFAERVTQLVALNQQAHDKAVKNYRDIQSGRFSISGGQTEKRVAK